MPECSHPKILFLVSLLLVALLNSIPTYLLNFIILRRECLMPYRAVKYDCVKSKDTKLPTCRNKINIDIFHVSWSTCKNVSNKPETFNYQ